MHGFHAGLARRLERLERRLGTILEPETPAQTSRRLELCRYALCGETPRDLDDGERLTFPKIVASVSILQELRDEGLVDAHGEPAVGNDYPHEDGDDGGQEPVWVP